MKTTPIARATHRSPRLIASIVTGPVRSDLVIHGEPTTASEPAATNDGGELVWNLGTLSAEQLKRIDLTLVTQTRGPLNCHAVVTFSAVAAHQVQVREPQLAVKMSGPDKVIAGERLGPAATA